MADEVNVSTTGALSTLVAECGSQALLLSTWQHEAAVAEKSDQLARHQKFTALKSGPGQTGKDND